MIVVDASVFINLILEYRKISDKRLLFQGIFSLDMNRHLATASTL